MAGSARPTAKKAGRSRVRETSLIDAFSDADAVILDTLSYSAALEGGGNLPSWLSFVAGTRTFSGTPLNADVGAINVRVTATDSQGATASDVFAITVSNTNDAPTATNLTHTSAYTEGAASVALQDIVVSDVDTGETITATLTLANPAAGVLTTSGSASYTAGTGVWTVSGTIAQVNAALAAVAFTPATDSDLDTTIATRIRDAADSGPADGTITLDVTPVNDAPVLAGLAASVTFGENTVNAAAQIADVADLLHAQANRAQLLV